MNKTPWTEIGSPWKTESAFWGWVRGVLRKGWSKHPIKIEYIKQFRKRIKNPNPRGKLAEVWGMTCQQCKRDVVQSEIEIDHIGDNASFTGLHDSESYMKHLFLVDFSSLESCCKTCHSIRSNAQNKGISFEESRVDKLIIETMKGSKEEILAIIAKSKYNGHDTSNAVKRKALIVKIIKGE